MTAPYDWEDGYEAKQLGIPVDDVLKQRPRYARGMGTCGNPACRSSWHGLPLKSLSLDGDECPGSHLYE